MFLQSFEIAIDIFRLNTEETKRFLPAKWFVLGWADVVDSKPHFHVMLRSSMSAMRSPVSSPL